MPLSKRKVYIQDIRKYKIKTERKIQMLCTNRYVEKVVKQIGVRRRSLEIVTQVISKLSGLTVAACLRGLSASPFYESFPTYLSLGCVTGNRYKYNTTTIVTTPATGSFAVMQILRSMTFWKSDRVKSAYSYARKFLLMKTNSPSARMESLKVNCLQM